MKPVYISATNIVTGLGTGVEANLDALNSGRIAIDTIEHFDTDRLLFHKASVAKHIRERNPRSVMMELTREVINDLPKLPEDTFLIWAGVKNDIEYIEAGQNPDLPYLPEHFIAFVQSKLGIHGGTLCCNAACAASTVAIALAAQKVAFGHERSVLVVAADIASRFTHTGFSALRALSGTDCRPFDDQRDGLCLGDGAAAIWITDGSEFPVQSTIAGWGIANDANHITGPARDGCGLIASIRQAMTISSIEPDEIEAFYAHGTGTVYNDAMELTAIETIFGEKRFPVFGVKGSIGHTLGAAGAIEVALCDKILHTNNIPPTNGMCNPEERAVGRVSSQSQTFSGNNILTTNSGFGGVNAAVILKPSPQPSPIPINRERGSFEDARSPMDRQAPAWHPSSSNTSTQTEHYDAKQTRVTLSSEERAYRRVKVLGGSWINQSGFAQLNEADSFEYQSGEPVMPPARGLFNPPLARYGRFDRYTKTGLAAMALALKDAGLDTYEDKRNIGVVLSTKWESFATDLKYYETTLEDGGIASSPNLFSYTLPNVVIGECAAYYKLAGPTFTVNDSMQPALDVLMCELTDTMVIGWLDSDPMGDQNGALFVVVRRANDNELYDYQYTNGALTDPEGKTIDNLMELVRDHIQKKGELA